MFLRHVPQAILIALVNVPWAGAETVEVEHKPLARITPGTVIARPAPKGWTDMVMLSKPRLGSGDVDATPAQGG